jgi:hypothetical protein
MFIIIDLKFFKDIVRMSSDICWISDTYVCNYGSEVCSNTPAGYPTALVGYLNSYGRIILKWISKKWDGAWTGLSWLKIGTGGGLF